MINRLEIFFLLAWGVLEALGFGFTAHAETARIKDLTTVRGNRSNQLLGMGVVVGLAGTGDSKKAAATNRAVANVMTRLGMRSTPDEVLTQSSAVVAITAELPPFAKIGDRIDVKISVVGDAKSLAGGTLLQTPLKGMDGKIYAMAQGAVVTGQANGSRNQVLTTALVPRSATIEREFPVTLVADEAIELSLRNADFTTNNRVAEAINQRFKGFYAESVDASAVRVTVPSQFKEKIVEFLAEVEQLPVEVNHRAVVVLNERTGTVVMGDDVVIGKVAVTHGELSIQVNGDGKDKASSAQSVMPVGGATVGELVTSLNALGLKPGDLVGIIQAIHAAGALQADLKFL